MRRFEQVTDQHLVDAYIERNEPIELHTGNPKVDAYIEDNDLQPIAEDLYECAGGHVWHVDDIVTELNLEQV
jgi:hypothetical protein